MLFLSPRLKGSIPRLGSSTTRISPAWRDFSSRRCSCAVGRRTLASGTTRSSGRSPTLTVPFCSGESRYMLFMYGLSCMSCIWPCYPWKSCVVLHWSPTTKASPPDLGTRVASLDVAAAGAVIITIHPFSLPGIHFLGGQVNQVSKVVT